LLLFFQVSEHYRATLAIETLMNRAQQCSAVIQVVFDQPTVPEDILKGTTKAKYFRNVGI
jgi:hypothetical protein